MLLVIIMVVNLIIKIYSLLLNRINIIQNKRNKHKYNRRDREFIINRNSNTNNNSSNGR